MLYSIDLDEVFDSLEGRSLGFILDLDDVKRINSSIVGLFSTTSGGFMFPPQIFIGVELKMTLEHKEFILAQAGGRGNHKFAVVANIDKFRRPRLMFDTPVYDEPRFESEIVLKAPALITLQGHLLDIIYLGTHATFEIQITR